MTSQRSQGAEPRGLPSLTYVQICGAGHSGSTLLGMILGSHTSAFYLGEARKARFIGDLRKPLRKRSCKYCGEACPIWGSFRWSEGCDLVAELAQRSGASLLVDSTKGLDWCQERAVDADAHGHQRVVLFLQRDGRAVFNSRRRKYPERDVVEQIDDWVQRIGETQAWYAAQQVPKAIVRYEELVTRPEEVLSSLCALIGVPAEDGMLRYDEREHHPLGGNNGTQFLASRAHGGATLVEPGARSSDYYRSHGSGLRLDTRWRSELDSEALALFEERAGQVNESMRWDRDVQG